LSAYHLSFRLRCDQQEHQDLVFTDDLAFHTLELPKYVVPGDNELCSLSGLEKWLCFLKQAGQRDVHELARLLADEVFEEASGVLDMISQSPENRQFYEARLKFLHDEEARLIADREEALAEGLAKGREEGAAQGTLIGKIQILQEIVGDSVTTTDVLLQGSADELSKRLSELQERLRTRGN
jgi:predicted transposase/invertase (TIGR01784 family)